MGNNKNNNQAFEHAVQKVSQIFCEYSFEDVGTTLFVSATCLRNVASPVQHHLLTAIFALLKPHRFQESNQISSYEDFKGLLEEVYPLLPSFPMLEDYVPEPDWGDVKFHHEGFDYKIFYGSELSNVFDYLMLFQILYASLDREYRKYSGRSPADELRQCLMLQDRIISEITSQPHDKQLKGISPGHIETPPSLFWQEVSSFYSNYKPGQDVNQSFLKQYSISSGSISPKSLERAAFADGVFSGSLLPAFFIEHNDRFFPILPRRYSSILLDSWSSVFARYHKNIDQQSNSYSMHVNAEVYKFLRQRIPNQTLLPCVGAVTEQGQPHEIMFSASFVSKDKLILVYVASPSHSGTQTSAELNRITPKLRGAIKLIGAPPVTLGLYLGKKIVKYDPDPSGEALEPLVVIVVPQASITQSIVVPRSLPGEVMGLDQFLGIMDEIETVDEVASFLEYLDEIDEKISIALTGPLDKFASFKSSHGVLIDGARKVGFIMLDPHWGSSMRYESLAGFWRLYPQVGFFDHPRSWRLRQEPSERIRLEAKGYFGCALHCQVGSTHVFASSPFDRMSFRQGQIASLLMECLEDLISRNKAILEKHTFFRDHNKLVVNFLPYSLVSRNDDFAHLRHLDPGDQSWCSERGFVERNTPGVAVVFSEETVADAFMEAKDRSFEITLLLEVVDQLNKLAPDPKVNSIRAMLSKLKKGRPRFKLSEVEKEVSFPEFVPVHEPSISHYKRARKRVAQLALRGGLLPGAYELAEAKARLNTLRTEVVSEIDTEVSKCSYRNAIPYLLERIDALSHDYEKRRLSLRYSLEHEVDYEREERYAVVHTEYLRQHKNFRYLIEKFAQLQPNGTTALDKDRFRYLVALIDKLHEIYAASDSLHYGVYPVGVSVSDDYLIEVRYEVDLEAMQKTYAEEQAMLDLGLVGNEDNRVDSPSPMEDHLKQLDLVFKQDVGVGLRSMVNVLQILSQWSRHDAKVQESSHYSASRSAIHRVCLKSIKDIDPTEIDAILNFLTLRSEDLIRVRGQDEPCEDLPVWEHQKRYSRYNLRPLILIEGRYYWGPYSTRRSGIIWSHTAVSGTLPADIQSPAVQKVLEDEKGRVEEALVDKTLAIVKRYTPKAEQNVKLHTRDRRGNHPEGLGDYDVLAFYPEKNTVFNIECKDILPVYCLKDAKRLREKIFGGPDTDRGYLEKVEMRAVYLSEHLVEIAKALKWSVDPDNLPKVVSIVVSRHSYWWTRFPPRSTDVNFLQVDLLSQFLDNL